MKADQITTSVTWRKEFDLPGLADLHSEISDTMRAAMNARVERQFAGLFTTATKPKDVEAPLTLDRLKAMIESLPARESFVVSRVFPPGVATVVRTPRENFTCLDPVAWIRLEPQIRRALESEGPPTCFGLPVTYIDPVATDDDDAACYRSRERSRILGLIAEAMIAAAERP